MSSPSPRNSVFPGVACGLLLAAHLGAQEAPAQEGAAPGLESSVWAAGDKLGPAAAFTIDDRGRVFVAESARSGGAGVFSVGEIPARIEEDLAVETVAQRRALVQNWLERGELSSELNSAGLAASPAKVVLRQNSEIITLLEDGDGDGQADRRTIFASGFNDEMDGPAAGLLIINSDLWFLCPPHLWLLRDFEKNDRANLRTVLVAGLGVRVGQPNHGPGPITFGPDGRLYFALGDRGYNVHTSEDRNYYGPTTGAVFRCWPDGQNLELFARGFRAPTALAFDLEGRLFVVDGALYLVPEGTEVGWEASLADNGAALAAWSAEKRLWCLPGIGSIGETTDLALCPGTALVPELQGRLLTASRNGIGAVTLASDGGRLRIGKSELAYGAPGVQKICFAPDGKLFFLALNGKKSSIGTLRSTTNVPRQQTAVFLKVGFRHRRVNELIPLLSHADFRVRFRAQLALVEKGWREVVPALVTVLSSAPDVLARRHAVWIMGRLARENPLLLTPLIGLVNDGDDQIRLLAAQVLADGRCAEAGPAVLRLLDDPAPAVRATAVACLGKLAPPGARAALLDVAARHSSGDEFLRHNIVIGLAALGDPPALLEATHHHASQPARLAGLLALRRLQNSLCGDFLNDADPAVRLEAARAVYDLPIETALPRLAEMLGKVGDSASFHPPQLLRLSLAANLRLGSSADAERVAAFAARATGSLPDDLRILALAGLASWDTPPVREPIWGRHAPVLPREAALARKPLLAHLPNILKNNSGRAGELAQRLQTLATQGPSSASEIVSFVGDESKKEGLRLFFLRELDVGSAAETANLENACRAALESQSPRLRIEARTILIRRKPAQALDLVASAMTSEHPGEKQSSISQLEAVRTRPADQWLLQLLERAASGRIDLAVLPELIEAAQIRERGEAGNGREFREALEKLRTSWRSASSDPLRPWRAAEHHGDATAGRALFLSPICRCLECHAINGRGAGTAPDLAGVAERFSSGGLVESIIQPSARIASGYGFVTAQRRDGSTISGTLKASNSEALTLRSASGLVEVSRAELKEMSPPASECRPVGALLTLRETRDLVSFLKTLK
ncbi:MAG: HEAT repeat domain-containing protein [Verrucomicrobiales bacterium]